MRTTTRSAALFVGLTTAAGLRAQEAPARAAFEVTSVKPTDLSPQQIDMRVLPGGTLTATSVTLKFLIRVAYGVQDVQISGGPGWMETQRYNLLAKPAENAKVQVLPMLRSLLEDRFKLIVGHTTKEVPVYELKMAKAGGKYGPNLHQVEPGDCPPEPPSPAKTPTLPCHGFVAGPGHLTGKRVTLSALAVNFSATVQRPVIDKSGVDANFDLELDWTPDPGLGARGELGLTRPDDSAPSFFTAVQEQLGLKLEGAKGPVDILVIERAEKPDAN
jgi:bla regulator protein BlaR1